MLRQINRAVAALGVVYSNVSVRKKIDYAISNTKSVTTIINHYIHEIVTDFTDKKSLHMRYCYVNHTHHV